MYKYIISISDNTYHTIPEHIANLLMPGVLKRSMIVYFLSLLSPSATSSNVCKRQTSQFSHCQLGMTLKYNMLYLWCNCGYTFRRVVHLRAFHNIMMSSIHLSIGHEPSCRLRKPPEISQHPFYKQHPVRQRPVKSSVTAVYLHATTASMRGEVTTKMSIRHSPTQ